MKKIIFCFLFVMPVLLFGQNIPRPNIPAPKGLSVNSFTGNLFYQRDEMSLRGTGFRIYQSFYYNASTDTLDYGYGHGWSFYYNIFYITTANSIIIQNSDAKKDTFLLVGSVYRSPVGIYDTLIKTGTTISLRSKDGRQEIFGNPIHKKITAMQDVNGNFVSLEYTGNYPSKIRNSTGRCLLLNWQNNHLTDAKDSANPQKKFSYGYDGNGDLVTVTNPLNGVMRFEYTSHNIARLADENNNPVVITYLGGKVKRIASCNTEQQFSFLLGQNKTYVSQTSQSGTITNGYFFDANNRLSALTDADGKQTIFNYDDKNNLIQWTDFKGASTKYEYDAMGNLTKETDPLGNTATYMYETTYNKIASFKDQKGNNTFLSYDGKGNLISIVKPGNITENFTYDANGKLVNTKNANGNTTTYRYNNDGDLVQVQYPIGDIQYQYNGSCCNVGKITDANGNIQEMTYDLLGRPTSVKDKIGNTIQYQYDAVGNVVKEIDPLGVPKEYGYDALNRLTSVKLKVGTWKYDYDGQSNLVKITDANGHQTQYDYNNKNQLIKETNAIGNATIYAYDINGNLTTRTDPNGNVENYTYDELNRLTEKNYPGNIDKYSYDATGNMVSAYNNNIAYSFDYDNLDRLVKKNILTWGKSLTYTFDNAGNRKTMTDYEGGSTNYSFDANNRLVSLTNPSNLTTGFIYDAGGRISKQTNANGTFTTYHYDEAGRMDSLINWQNASAKISFFYYTFDQYGNRLSMTDKHGSNTYTYDSAYRLTKVAYADGSVETFAIDGSGNRTQKVKNGVTIPYSYNNVDQIQTAGPSTYAFDANGNTILQSDSLQKVYNYDGENRLLGVQLAPQRKVTYQYDPFGDKIMMLDTLQNQTRMIYDGDNLLGELNGANSTINKYTTAFGMDQWLGIATGGSNYTYQKDGLNSTTEMTGQNGTVQNEYNYDAYGNILTQNGIIKNELLYSGKYYERAVGLYYNRARFYNSNVGRFVTKDLFSGYKESPLSINKYAFVGNDPINLVDQDGNSWISYSDVGFFIAGVGIEAIAGESLLINAGLGGVKGVVDTWTNPDNNKSLKCYLYNAGIGAGTGLIPVGKLIDKIPGAKIYIKQSNKLVTQLIKKVKNFNGNFSGFKYELRRRGTDALKGLGIKFSSDEGKDKASETAAESFFSSNPCEPKEPVPGSNEPPYGPPAPPTKVPVEVITPHDPNEITGPGGYDSTVQWVSVNETLPFKVTFENSADAATAPAQKVTVYAAIPDKININSLRISDYGFGNFNYTVPANTTAYTNRLNVADSLGVFVDVTAGLDVANHRAFWVFQSIDPSTGLANTLDANRGFLLVNDSITHRGEGYVNFTLQPAATDKTGDTVSTQASIVFDAEAPIPTNIWTNKIDAVSPTSKIDTLITNQNEITLKWSGHDDLGGSGIRDYAIYYSADNGPFKLFEDKVASQSTTFTAMPGVKYCFYSIATDNTGNLEHPKNSCEVANNTPLPVTWLYFTGQAQAKNALLQWATTTEKNTKEFAIERSLDGANFSTIGIVASKGGSVQTNSYMYTDINAMLLPTQVLYYRLKQIDKDGKFTYSTIVIISITPTSNTLAVKAFPNPFDQSITLQISNDTLTTPNATINVSLYTIDGRLVYQRIFAYQRYATILINDLPMLAPGLYTLKAEVDKISKTIKLLRK